MTRTLDELELADEIYGEEGDAVDVFCWRMEQLMRAGYSPVIAGTLAANTTVDLHTACMLRAAGCPERTAFLILY